MYKINVMCHFYIYHTLKGGLTTCCEAPWKHPSSSICLRAAIKFNFIGHKNEEQKRKCHHNFHKELLGHKNEEPNRRRLISDYKLFRLLIFMSWKFFVKKMVTFTLLLLIFVSCKVELYGGSEANKWVGVFPGGLTTSCEAPFQGVLLAVFTILILSNWFTSHWI